MAATIEERTDTDAVDAVESTDGNTDESASHRVSGAGGDVTVDIPASASEAEADAIVAAVQEYLRTRRRSTGAGEPVTTETDGTDQQWAVAGRMRRLGHQRGRLPADASSDPWAAAGRTSR